MSYPRVVTALGIFWIHLAPHIAPGFWKSGPRDYELSEGYIIALSQSPITLLLWKLYI